MVKRRVNSINEIGSGSTKHLYVHHVFSGNAVFMMVGVIVVLVLVSMILNGAFNVTQIGAATSGADDNAAIDDASGSSYYGDCSETDGGLDFNTEGTVVFSTSYGSGDGYDDSAPYDRCASSISAGENPNYLTEFTCKNVEYPNVDSNIKAVSTDSSGISTVTYNCEKGCKDGRCMTCKDYDVSYDTLSNKKDADWLVYCRQCVAGDAVACSKVGGTNCKAKADLNSDGAINVGDIVKLIYSSCFNKCTYYDLNGDSLVNAQDVDWEVSCEQCVNGDAAACSLVGGTGCIVQADIGGSEDGGPDGALNVFDKTKIINSGCYVATAKTSPCYEYGDIDGNGFVDSSDDTLIQGIIAGTLTPTQVQKDKADVNGDGQVSTSDWVSIRGYVGGTITTFPVCDQIKNAKDGYLTGTGTHNCNIHSADQDKNWVISATEANKVLVLMRAGKYHCADTTGFNYAIGEGAQNCFVHSADLNKDWKISYFEANRINFLWKSGGNYRCAINYDLSADNAINKIDTNWIVYCRQCVAGEAAACSKVGGASCKANADLNMDGAINVFDITKMITCSCFNKCSYYDVNADSKVNNKDVDAINDCRSKPATDQCKISADLNADGSINVGDSSSVISSGCYVSLCPGSTYSQPFVNGVRINSNANTVTQFCKDQGFVKGTISNVRWTTEVTNYNFNRPAYQTMGFNYGKWEGPKGCNANAWKWDDCYSYVDYACCSK